jgi:hypothetical protein
MDGFVLLVRAKARRARGEKPSEALRRFIARSKVRV